MSSLTVMLDMDGVLVDWIEGVLAMFDVEMWEYREAAKAHLRANGKRAGPDLLARVCGVSNNALREEINDQGEEFWRGLLPTPCQVALLHELTLLRRTAHVQLVILSSPCSGVSGVYEGKRAWLKKYMGEDVSRSLVLCPAHLKPLLSSPGMCLIDNNGETCAEWRKRGGSVVHWPALPEFDDYPAPDEVGILLAPLIRRAWGC